MGFDVKAIMFDLDGTLVHTAPEIASAANEMLAELKLPILQEQQIERFIGEGAQLLIRRCVEVASGTPVGEATLQQSKALFYQHYADRVTFSRPYEGVVDSLAILKQQGFRLACVTNKPERFTLPLLRSAALAEYFEIVVSGDTLAKKKPDPMQLRHICAQLNVLETEAMLVGDSYTDVLAAHAAGCYIVTVPYGYNQGRMIDESQVDATIENIPALVGLLT
ncbi:MAG: phosphoglycolate phosphatase [Betaproteobacteria bacterium HGW-Betaproteobacteria-22]|nr:MAG: phosphoglycolate phosphatase [Betaproteobacteria bacterium HGW-Betaproteobacteria-22]